MAGKPETINENLYKSLLNINEQIAGILSLLESVIATEKAKKINKDACEKLNKNPSL